MDNGVIMFKEVTQAEQGGYLCTAENDMGVITATATLLVDGKFCEPVRHLCANAPKSVTLKGEQEISSDISIIKNKKK